MGQPLERRKYLPAEDTYLLKDALRSFTGDACLEIGFGSGAVLASVAGRFRLAVGTDVVSLEDARSARLPSLGLVIADRAQCFRDGVFDLVFFNPPYLPAWPIEDLAVDGGPTGIEVPVSFLGDALRVLTKEGTIVALMSDEGDAESFLSHCSDLGLEVDSTIRKKLFYETLSVLILRRNRDAEI